MTSLVHRLKVTALALAGFAATLATPVAAQTPAKGSPLKIVAFGDSLTAGYGLSAQDAFPAALERALKAKGHNVEVENAGVSGDTASGGLSRVDWSIADGTDAVIVELGANDMLRGVEPKVTRQALDDILAKLKARNIPVLLSGMRAAPTWAPSMSANMKRSFRRSRRNMTWCSIRSFWRASPPIPSLPCAMAFIRTEPACRSLSMGYCRKSKS
jgi:lysophospholipase L1-like esterase